MRATLDVRENRGIFSTSWTVECWIEFTELELAAIRYGKLDAKVVYTTGHEPERPTTLGDIRRNGGLIRWKHSSLLRARKDHDMIEQDLLPTIKGWLEAVDGFGNGSKTIEL